MVSTPAPRRRPRVQPAGRRVSAVGAVVTVVALAAGCGGSASKTDVAAQVTATAPVTQPTTPSAGTTPTPTAQTPTSTVDPGTLPQTHVLPSPTDPMFLAGVQNLWQAIVTDDPTPALPFFFPETAYVQVKALSNPAADYRNRLIAFYRLDIQAAHRLGADAKDAEFVGVTVPTNQAQWIVPGVEYNKGSYYRVYGTRLSYRVNGRTKSFGLFSLISWRGQWYIVHLGPSSRPKPVGVVYEPQS